MIHRGEIVQKAVRESGISVVKLAERIGMSRRNVYNLFENDKLNWDVIKKVGKVIHHDFRKEFEELNQETMMTMVGDLEAPSYKKYDHTMFMEELNYWKTKCIELLEQNNQLLLELGELRRYKRKQHKDS